MMRFHLPPTRSAKQFLIGFTALLMLTGSPALAARAIDVAIVTDGPWARGDEITTRFETEIRALLAGEYEVRFQRMSGESWTAEGVARSLDAAYADPEVEAVVAMGVLASHVASRRGPLPKPTLAPWIIDRDLQGLPKLGGTSGVRNLNYLTPTWGIEHQLETFRSISPFEHVVVLGNGYLLAAIPELITQMQSIGERMGTRISVLAVQPTTTAVLDELPEDVDAVFVVPLAHFSDGDLTALAAKLVKLRLPSFAMLGRRDVVRGFMAGLTPDAEFQRIGRRVAINLQRALSGEALSSLNTRLELKRRLYLNMATVRSVGARPGWDVLTEAELIDTERHRVERSRDLTSAVLEAIEVNLDLVSERLGLLAGQERVGEARSRLLPQLDLDASGLVIDEDRAEASFGTQAERTVTGSATLTQLLYSDDAWAGFTIEEHLQSSREQDLEALRLDVARAAGTTYLEVLRAKTLERIQRDNLELTRSNLELARSRVEIGSSRRSEVYRWESELANNQQSVVSASAERNVAEIGLNRLLHRPLEESFGTEEASLALLPALTGGAKVERYTGDPWSFRRFREFMVVEAFDAAPELAGLDASIAAQAREVTRTERAFWLPTLAARGQVDHRFDEHGAGSGSIASAPAGSGQDDTDWSVGLEASLPLITGGERTANLRKARLELNQFEIQRAATAEQLEERVRAALHRAGASSASIALSRTAAEAAERNLELVSDAYAQGTENIINLLDAQNSALVADEQAANAVYDFLIDLLEAQRASGRMPLIMEATQQASFKQRLEAYFAADATQGDRE